MVFLLLRTETPDAFPLEFAAQFTRVFLGYFTLLKKVSDYFLCLRLRVTSADEILSGWVEVAKFVRIAFGCFMLSQLFLCAFLQLGFGVLRVLAERVYRDFGVSPFKLLVEVWETFS